MNFYPTYDETYYEHNEPPFHPTPEHHECECGAELTRENPPLYCEHCGDMWGCADCIHICEYCSRKGCESCMTDTVDGWAHSEVCAAANKAAEDRKDREAQEMLERIRKAG